MLPTGREVPSEEQPAKRAAPADRSWKAFSAALAGVLPILEDGQFLVLVRKRTNHFVQFASSGRAGLRAEAVSNAFLKGKARLDTDQLATLLRMGWSNAGPNEGAAKSVGSPNFFRDWGKPVEPAAVAKHAVATLRDVYGVPLPADLEYWASTRFGGEIILPTLGISQDRKARKRLIARAKEAPRFVKIESKAQLAGELSRALGAMTGKETLEPNGDGDFSFTTGRSVVFVRPRDDEPTVRIFSRVASDILPGPGLLAHLNELNGEFGYVRFQADDGFVTARMDLNCALFRGEEFRAAVTHLCRVADEVRPGFEGRLPTDAATHAGTALAEANHSARRATAAWLTGEGLASASERLRVQDVEEPIPAPLIEQWRQKLHQATSRAVQSADAVLAHVNGEARLEPEAISEQVDLAAAQAAEAERACRALARLSLGITSHREECEETARLERAAVLVLSGSGLKVEEEEIVFFGRDRSELASEAAGLLCWMLTQQGCSREIGNPRAGRPTLTVIVDGRSNLLIRAKDEMEAWDAPVTVIEPARYIAGFLSEHGGAALDA